MNPKIVVSLVLFLSICLSGSVIGQALPRAKERTVLLPEKRPNYDEFLANGWYKANVRYTNFKTQTQADYVLSVEIEDNKVIKISFGDGSSVHSGINNSNYIYNGGYLRLLKNDDGKIIFASTDVRIYIGSSILQYHVAIE